jgi:hypothetical protein
VLAGPVLANRLAVTTAQELLKVDEQDARAELVDRAIASGWNAHQTGRAIRERCDSHQSDLRESHRCDEELLRLLRAAVAILPADGTDALADETRREARTLLRALGQRLR